MEKRLVQQTGTTWKNVSEALQRAKQNAGEDATDDEIFALAFETLKPFAEEKQRKDLERNKKKLAQQQQQREGDLVKYTEGLVKYKEDIVKYKEKHPRLLQQPPDSFVMGQEGIANYDIDEIPVSLSSCGVSIATWKLIHSSTNNVAKSLKGIVDVGMFSNGPVMADVRKYFKSSIQISNLLAQLNFILNSHGILVQIPLDDSWNTKSNMKRFSFVYLTVMFVSNFGGVNEA